MDKLAGLLLVLVCLSSAFANVRAAESSKLDKHEGTFGSVFGLFKEVVARSATTSEILTLNLTNLLVLLLLKGILIAIGIAGGLGFGGLGLGRSAVAGTKPYFSTDDLRWGATYLISSADKDFTCLNSLACAEPENASEYVTGCKFMLKAAKVAHDFMPRFLSYNEKYEEICKNIKDAAFFNGDCDRQYPCALQNV